MTMFAEAYGNDTHCLFKAEILSTLTPVTILEMSNCNWYNRRLDEGYISLKSIITILNFCCPPTNPADYRRCVDIQTNLANSQREEALGQCLEHSRPKTWTP